MPPHIRALLQHRARVKALVRDRFLPFGEEALAVVHSCALHPATLHRLLDRLDLSPRDESLGAALDALATEIRAIGPAEFVRRSRTRRGSAPDAAAPQRGEERFRRFLEAAREREVAAPRVPAAPREREFRPTASASPAGTGETGTRWVATTTYQGPDRRGGERRVHPDRRCAHDAVGRNQRFGGDRRTEPRGRRAEDRARPERWWRYLGRPDPSGLPWAHASSSS